MGSGPPTVRQVVLFALLCVTAVATEGRTRVRRDYRAATLQQPAALSASDDALLEDLSKRSFLFFWEQADAATGIVRDRSRTDGTPVEGGGRNVGSIAAVGFGLTGLCIASERQWIPRAKAVDRARRTLRFFAERIDHQRGWFYHFIDLSTGKRAWN